MMTESTFDKFLKGMLISMGLLIIAAIVSIVMIVRHGNRLADTLVDLAEQERRQAEQTATVVCAEYTPLKVETLSTQSVRTCYKVTCFDAKEQRVFDRYACVEKK